MSNNFFLPLVRVVVAALDASVEDNTETSLYRCTVRSDSLFLLDSTAHAFKTFVTRHITSRVFGMLELNTEHRRVNKNVVFILKRILKRAEFKQSNIFIDNISSKK